MRGNLPEMATKFCDSRKKLIHGDKLFLDCQIEFIKHINPSESTVKTDYKMQEGKSLQLTLM